METNKISCDACGRDLSYTGNKMLALHCENIPHVDGSFTHLLIPKPIEKIVHFCDLSCLKMWCSSNL